MRQCINGVLEGATEKKREFMETIELQIGLKNYDPQKDKRFAGTIKLPHIPRPKLRICILGDAFHCEKAAGLGLDFKNADGLKAFNKNKKLVKKFAAKYAAFLASESLIKQIPRLLGPGLNKAGKFPTLLSNADSMDNKMNEIRSNVKFQLKKVLDMGGVVAAVENAYMKQRLVESNTARVRAIENGELTVVGVNDFTETEASPLTVLTALNWIVSPPVASR